MRMYVLFLEFPMTALDSDGLASGLRWRSSSSLVAAATSPVQRRRQTTRKQRIWQTAETRPSATARRIKHACKVSWESAARKAIS